MDKPLWTPSHQFIESSNLQHYITWLKENKGLSFSSYHELWYWSVENIEAFWESIWLYFDIIHSGDYTQVLSGTEMPFYSWFNGTTLNYAEHIFRKITDKHPAIIYQSENSLIKEMSWKDLHDQVASLQQYLKQCGVKAGDCVAAYITCIPEATIAFLATNSIGAVWTSCSPDFGTSSIVERFVQVAPKILIAVDGYNYGGKHFDKTEVVQDLVKSIPSLERVIIYADPKKTSREITDVKIISWEVVIKNKHLPIQFERVPFNHPIWVLYSSGTSGLPKAITHSHGGILLEQLKYVTFHNDFKPGERCFWYTTTGWMMWNYIHGSLLAGSTMVLYDGSPAQQEMKVLWQFINEAGINHFGTSAGFILANKKNETQPAKQFNLSELRSIGVTGSTLPPEGFTWIYDYVKKDIWLAAMSGGTDVCSAFVGGNPMLPVYAGEIQCRALGCKLEAFNENGQPITEDVGEMVITEPMPSMPIYFWNDSDFRRYKESYFEIFPEVWCHGDWIKITVNNGIIIYGRSDAILNRGGVRIGTSEIYRTVDKIEEVKDSMIVCIEKEGGEFWMPLFVVMKEDFKLIPEVINKITTSIRNDYSPRHIPDVIIAVPDIPYTISGKKTEIPVKKVLMGNDPKKIINSGSLRNPDSMKFFIALAKDKKIN